MAKFLIRIDTSTGVGNALVSSGDQRGAWLSDSSMSVHPSPLVNGDIFIDRYSKLVRCWSSDNGIFSNGNIYNPSDHSKSTAIYKQDYMEVRSTISAVLATGRDRMAAECLLSTVYMAGGNSSGGDVNTIDYLTYDSTRGAAGVTLSASKCEMAAATTTFSGVTKMYMFGGSNTTNVIEKLKSDGTISTSGATMTASKRDLGDSASRAPQSWTNNSYIYQFGGNTGSTTNVIQVLQSDSTCATVSTTVLTSNTSCAASIRLYDKIYVASVGGSTSGGTSAINKLTGDATYTCTAISAVRTSTAFYPGSGEINNRGYVFGGAYFVTSIDRIASDAVCASISATLAATTYGSPGASR